MSSNWTHPNFGAPPPAPNDCESSSSSSVNLEGDSSEETGFSDTILDYINQVLMEDDDSDNEVNMIPTSALHAAEKSLSDIISQKHPITSCSNYCSNTSLQSDISLHSLSSPSESSSLCNLSSLNPTGGNSQFDENSPIGYVRGRKQVHMEVGNELEEEVGRSSKRLVTCTVDSVLEDMLEMMMIHEGENEEKSKLLLSRGRGGGGKKCPKRRSNKKETVDLRALLTQCVQAMANNDLTSTNELLRQIRWHSTPFGDKIQRLSHYFAVSFDARLSGTGHLLCKVFGAKRKSDITTLKASNLFVSKFPFTKMSNFLITQMIMKQVEKASSVHIIHFGIFHGHDWPPLIHKLSKRVGGPPKIRITGLEYPDPGFQTSAMIEKTGRRLASYCERLGVPFEYNCLARNYDDIRVRDFKIEKGEVLVAVSMYRFKYLPDDSVSEDSPRNTVLKLIRRISPDIFIHGVANGAYNSPFLVSRFKEAFLHFSAIFDMFEANVAEDDPERMVFEREVFGMEILNTIACEGQERVERPETYKQWHNRHVQVGFSQLPLDRENMKKARSIVNSCYHEDFLVDENGHWLLQGWKGRVLYALSFWKPA